MGGNIRMEHKAAKCGMVWTGWKQVPVTVSGEHGNECSGTTEGTESLVLAS